LGPHGARQKFAVARIEKPRWKREGIEFIDDSGVPGVRPHMEKNKSSSKGKR
jgi:hypothetical protein